VAGGASAGFFTGVIDFDVVVEQYVKDGLTFRCVFDNRAVACGSTVIFGIFIVSVV